MTRADKVSPRGIVATCAWITALAASTAGAQTAPAAPARVVRPAPPPAAPAPVNVLPIAPCGRVELAPLVQLPVGKSTVIRPSVPIARILLGNPENARAARPSEEVDAKEDRAMSGGSQRSGAGSSSRPGVADVDVLLLGPTEVYLLGKTIGSTNVVMIDRSGVCTAFDVVVGMDMTGLQNVVAQLLPAEKDLKISAAFDSVVLSGIVTDPEALQRVLDLARAFVRGQDGGNASTAHPRIVNMLEVGAPQQVMLEVKVAEVSKALLDSFGIDFSRAYTPGDSSMIRFLSGILGGSIGQFNQISGTGPNGVPLSSVGTVVGGTIPLPGTQGGNVTLEIDPLTGARKFVTTYGTVPGRSVTNATANMQKTDGLVKVLAEPSVMAISGQTGSFLAGGKIFIPVASVDAGGSRTVTLEEKEFGVSVRFTPTVLGNGRINLKVRPEVSELSATGVTIQNATLSTVLPSFTSRRAETTVQLMDGQSFAIGGLVKNNTTTNIRAFPFLGELPILGTLFRSTEFQTDKSELVFVITPRLVKPLPPDFRLPTDSYVPPTRKELILDGKLEGKAAPAAAPKPAEGAPVGGGLDLTPKERK